VSAVHNFRAEKLLLCTLLEKKHLRQDFYHRLQPELFGTSVGREICERMLALSTYGKEIPTCGVMTEDPGLSEESRIILKLDRTDREKIKAIHRGDVESLIEQLVYFYQKRVVYEAVKHASEKLNTDAMIDMQEVRQEVQASFSQMDNLGPKDEGIRALGRDGNMDDAYLREHLKEGGHKSVLKTAFPSIDDRATWSRGNMIMLTAMRGHGKSVLVKSLGLRHFQQQNHSVFICSMEMEEWEYVARAMSEITKVPHDKFRRQSVSKAELDNILDVRRCVDELGMEKNARWTLKTVKSPNYTPALLHQELKHQGYDVVIVDYLNLFKRGKRELWDAIYDHTKYLKMMAKDLGVLLYVVGQLNEEGRAKYAKAAEEDADAWIYWSLEPGQPIVKFFHGKARHYPPFSFKLVFDGRFVAFKDHQEFEDKDDPKRNAKLKKELTIIRQASEEHASTVTANMEEVLADRKKANPTLNKGKRGSREKRRQE
jgi:replicative DNA helicase